MQVEGQVGSLVDLSVLPLPLKVVIEFLDHGDGEHEDKRRHKRDQETNTECWDDLRQGNQQEEQIEEVFELVEEYNWHKTIPGVLAVVDGVIGELLVEAVVLNVERDLS